jgi:hypothetical protein
MTTFSRLLVVTASISTIAITGAFAQANNPNDAGGSRGSQISMPDYPTGYTNPALSPGDLPPGATAAGLPARENPEVPGATGSTIVRGDHSTIEGDRQGTIQQKTGADTASDAPG